MTTLNDYAAKSLGSENSYAVFTDKVDKTLLNPMPRDIVRRELDLLQPTDDVSVDVWHCYEATYLDINSGKPVAGILKITIPSSSPNMIESKSFKVYLNTFDMTKMDKQTFIDTIKADLSECAGAEVGVRFHDMTRGEELIFDDEMSIMMIDESNILDDVYSLDDLDCEITDYNGNTKLDETSLIQSTQKRYAEYKTSALRSRCRHTKQKDSGSAYIVINGTKVVNPIDLYKYIISLRETNEFHEFCCEKIYNEIKRLVGADSDVGVALFYTRRGSLDINPIRIDAGLNKVAFGHKLSTFINSKTFVRGAINQ